MEVNNVMKNSEILNEIFKILEDYRDELSVPKKINERNMYVRFVKSIKNNNTKYRCDEYALTKLLTTTDMEPADTYNISIMKEVSLLNVENPFINYRIRLVIGDDLLFGSWKDETEKSVFKLQGISGDTEHGKKIEEYFNLLKSEFESGHVLDFSESNFDESINKFLYAFNK